MKHTCFQDLQDYNVFKSFLMIIVLQIMY